MNDNFKLWLERLRDPASEKATNALGYVNEAEPENISKGAMCCLGHACYVAGNLERVPTSRHELQTKSGDRALLDAETVKWLGIEGYPNLLMERDSHLNSSGEPSYNIAIPVEVRPPLGYHENSTVTTLNDSTDLTLAQIADVLEKTFDPDAPWNQ